MSEERWKPVLGYDGDYEISDMGRVHSYKYRWKPPKMLSPGTVGGGYKSVALSFQGQQRTHMVHRLVLEAFVGPCPEGMEACHNDGNPVHNVLQNLRWATHSENARDRWKHGTMMNRISLRTAKKIRKQLLRGEYISDVSRQHGVSYSCVHSIATGRTWQHLGNPIQIPASRGERHRRAKLTEKSARKVKQLLRDGAPISALAAKFGVSRGAVYAIKYNRTWRHIP